MCVLEGVDVLFVGRGECFVDWLCDEAGVEEVERGAFVARDVVRGVGDEACKEGKGGVVVGVCDGVVWVGGDKWFPLRGFGEEGAACAGGG